MKLLQPNIDFNCPICGYYTNKVRWIFEIDSITKEKQCRVTYICPECWFGFERKPIVEEQIWDKHRLEVYFREDMELFPDMTKEEIENNVKAKWEIKPLPQPKGDWLRCPVCGGKPHLRHWHFFMRHRGNEEGRISGRCDVGWKCTVCSNTWTHGVPVPSNMVKTYGESTMSWREGKKILEG